MNILVYVNQTPKEYLAVKKTTTISSIKKYLEKYGDVKVQMFVNSKNELKAFTTNQYDDITLESIWKNMNKPKIMLTSYVKQFTGNRDVDMLIIKSLDDETMVSLCRTNKYISSLCSKLYEDEKFWENRLREVVHESLIKKPKNKTWHDYYISFFKYSDREWGNLIKKVFRQVHPDTGLSQDALNYIVTLIKPIWKKVQRNNDVESLQEILGEIYKHAMRELNNEKGNFYKQYDKKRIIEYLVAEIIELSGNVTRDERRRRIMERDVIRAIKNDKELSEVFGL